MNKTHFFRTILRSHKFLIISPVIIVVAIFGYLYLGNSKINGQDIVVAKRADLTQVVSLSGKIKPVEEINLGFEKAGKISSVGVNVGDKVSKGDVLAMEENADLFADLEQAKAVVRKEESKLAELYNGTRKEEIALDESKVEKAKIDLTESRKNLEDSIRSAYTKSDDVVGNTVDQFFQNPKNNAAQFSVTLNDGGTIIYFDVEFNLKFDINNKRIKMEGTLNDWNGWIKEIDSSSNGLDKYTDEARKNLNEVKSLLDKLAEAVNSFKSHSFKYETTVSSYKSSISGARTVIDSAIDSLATSDQNMKSSLSNLTISESELALKKAGTLPEKIIAQQSIVEEVQAKVAIVEAQISKTVLRSPIDGVITKQDAKLGQISSANTSLISIISAGNYEIESFAPEISISKIKIDNPAKVTFDAYDSETAYEAVVSKIDPAETIIDGLPNYKITLKLPENDSRIKSGMTANLHIQTSKRENAIVIPLRAIISKNGKKTVRVVRGKNEEEVEIETGIKGSDGGIEIISGIEGGDKVLLSPNK